MDKLYKTVLATVIAASVLVCSACAGRSGSRSGPGPGCRKNIAGDDREDYHTCLDI